MELGAVLGENLVTTMLDLEVASGNDQTFTHSPIRKTARTMMQFYQEQISYFQVIVQSQTMIICLRVQTLMQKILMII